MLRVLMVIIKIISFECSSDYQCNTLPGPTDQTNDSKNTKTNCNIQLNPPKFNYKEIKESQLGRMKNPYINCNRNIFASLDMDLFDIFLLDEKSRNQVFLEIDNTRSRILIVLNALKELLKIDYDIDPPLNENISYRLDNFLGVPLDTQIKKSLNCKLIQLKEESLFKFEYCKDDLIVMPPTHAEDINILIRTIDDYIFDSTIFNLFSSQLKPSSALKDILYNEFLHPFEIECILCHIIIPYQFVADGLKNFKEYYLNINKNMSSIYSQTSNVLKNNIFVKWEIVFTKNRLIRIFQGIVESEFSDQIIIYSINGKNLTDKLSDVILCIVEDNIINSNINKIDPPKHTRYTFDYYEIYVNDITYTIKKFDLKKNKWITIRNIHSLFEHQR